MTYKNIPQIKAEIETTIQEYQDMLDGKAIRTINLPQKLIRRMETLSKAYKVLNNHIE